MAPRLVNRSYLYLENLSSTLLQMQVAFNNLSICGEWGTAASTRIPHPRRSLYLPCAM